MRRVIQSRASCRMRCFLGTVICQSDDYVLIKLGPGCRWLDKAAIKTDNEPLEAIEESQPVAAGSMKSEILPGWANEITVTHVQEVKVVSSLLPILATNLVFQMFYNNIFTLFISQGKKPGSDNISGLIRCQSSD